ncbi:MAG: hypothetical protein HND53_11070 [Proteobacteria bacterium]|nr:hypothetical protein [Pseudomonadota bacterium]NOG61034.1 hypothetical protein [Pseudomonadota bacterium]
MNSISTMDVSDAIEEASFKETKEKKSIMKMIKQFATLSQVLRTVGAFSVVASMSIFLLQDWSNGSDLHRYYLLLSQSVLLAIGGFSMAFLLKENKGARVFFGLSLISIAANLTTLGALIFSYVQWGGELSNYPDIALWTVSSGTSVAIALSIAAIVLIPITIFGFKVMARQSAMPLTAAYLLSNSMLLLPVRDTLFVSLIAGASILLLLTFVSKLIKKDPKLRTAEGKFARILLFVAPIIMLIRSLWLYQADEMIYTIIAFTGFMTLRHCSLQLDIQSQLRKFTEFLSIPTAFFVALPASQLIDKILPVEFTLPAFALIFAAHMIELARRSSDDYKGGALFLAGLVTSLSFIIHLGMNETLFNGILCAFAGMSVITLGYINKSKAITIFGLITTTVAAIYDFSHIFEIVDLFSWGSLAVIGVSAIVIGSVIERHGVAIKLRIDKSFKKAEARF